MIPYKNIHFLLMYPLNTAPGQRFRFEQYFPVLDESGIKYSVHCFYDNKTYQMVIDKKGKFQLSIRLLWCFMKQVWHLLFAGRYDCFMIQRGATPFGPPISEWIIRHIYRKPIIYDFDDAIWHGQFREKSIIMRWIKSRNKIASICKWADKVVVGNKYLAAYASEFNKNVFVIPMVLSNVNDSNAVRHENPKPVIGWTGSHSTLMYVEQLEDVLLRLRKKYEFDVMIMANKPPNFKDLQVNYVPWSEKAEKEELGRIDIGIMPLPDDEWTRGKCGLKAVQYMALSKPAVVSAVGVNVEIVDHGVNGFICNNDEDWEKYLEKMITDRNLVESMGGAAFQKVQECYTLKKGTFMWCEVLNSKS